MPNVGDIDCCTRELAMKIETRRVYDVLVADMDGRLDSVSSGDAEIASSTSYRETISGSCSTSKSSNT
jgi:hypothetical protein